MAAPLSADEERGLRKRLAELDQEISLRKGNDQTIGPSPSEDAKGASPGEAGAAQEEAAALERERDEIRRQLRMGQ